VDEPLDMDLLAEPEEEIRRYSVEVIIFEYNDGATVAGEVFLPDELPDIVELQEPVVEEIVLPDYRGRLREFRDYENVVLEEIQLHGPVELFFLKPEELTLTNEYARLKRLDAYNPVMHAGWVQTTVAPEDAQAIRLRRLGDPPLRLDGSLTLYLSRYLHLVVDLALNAGNASPEQTVQPENVPYYGDSRYEDDYTFADASTATTPQVFFRIEEDRIFRNGELRYFDHPKFGVLAKISRYEMEETTLPAETDEEFLLPAPPAESPPVTGNN
jgi:hypothetical protein